MQASHRLAQLRPPVAKTTQAYEERAAQVATANARLIPELMAEVVQAESDAVETKTRRASMERAGEKALMK